MNRIDRVFYRFRLTLQIIKVRELDTNGALFGADFMRHNTSVRISWGVLT